MSGAAIGFGLFLLGLLILGATFRIWKSHQPNGYHRMIRGQSSRALQRLQGMSPAAIITYLRKMNPHAVEEIVLDAAAAAGHKIRRNKAYTGDGGIDGQILVDGVWHLVQTKRYAKTINPKHVHEFSQLCALRRQPGLFVHCGRTGDKSRQNATAQVRFISGSGIVDLINGKSLNTRQNGVAA